MFLVPRDILMEPSVEEWHGGDGIFSHMGSAKVPQLACWVPIPITHKAKVSHSCSASEFKGLSSSEKLGQRLRSGVVFEGGKGREGEMGEGSV